MIGTLVMPRESWEKMPGFFLKFFVPLKKYYITNLGRHKKEEKNTLETQNLDKCITILVRCFLDFAMHIFTVFKRYIIYILSSEYITLTFFGTYVVSNFLIRLVLYICT